MASIRKRGGAWRAEVYRDGKRDSQSFRTKAEAVAWSMQREAELVGKRLPDRTLADALKRYGREVSPTHKGERWEVVRCDALARIPLAARRLATITASDMAQRRDERLREVTAGTVRREMGLLRSVFDYAIREWGWLKENPLATVKKPPAPPARRRRITDDEIARVTMALGYDGGDPKNASQRVATAFLLAIETAMRSSEITGLTWGRVGEKSVTLPKTKNGDQRDVPLSTAARAIIAAMPHDSELVFGLDLALRDALFRKAVKRAGIDNLHFHDSRAEAIWRLSKKLDVMELARMIGHRDLRSLMIYYNTSADELADCLG